MGNNDIKTLLPTGEKLKPLLNKSVITESDMNNILKKRGVFICSSEKKKIVPYLTMSLLSPKEFEELQELQKTKEDSIKYRTKNVLSNSKTNLNELIANDIINVDEMMLQINDCQFNSDANFSTINSNKMAIEYEIIREDYNKDWASAENTFIGRIEVEKNQSTSDISFVSEYTSAETEEINNLILKKIIKDLKDKQEIDEQKVLEITSDDFTNEERFEFLLALTKDSPNSLLRFKSVRNIEVGPDKNTNVHLLSSDVMLDNSVKNIIINGEKGETLQNIEYVTNKEFHKVLILRAVQIEYEFNVVGASGTCIIEYGFPHFFRTNKKSKVFEVTLNKLWFSKNSVGRNKTISSRKVLEEFNKFYMQEYRKIKGSSSEDLGLSG